MLHICMSGCVYIAFRIPATFVPTYSSLVQANKNIPSALGASRNTYHSCAIFMALNLNFGEFQTNRILSPLYRSTQANTGSEYLYNKQIKQIHNLCTFIQQTVNHTLHFELKYLFIQFLHIMSPYNSHMFKHLYVRILKNSQIISNVRQNFCF